LMSREGGVDFKDPLDGYGMDEWTSHFDCTSLLL